MKIPNVLVTVFEVESEGYQAFTELKKQPFAETYLVSEAALIKKEAGGFKVLDSFDSGAYTANDKLIGGLVGMSIGVLGSPIGVMLGASLGTMLGVSKDSMDLIGSVSMLEQMAGKLADDMVALIGLADEESEEALDAFLSKFKTTIARFDAAVVAEEVKKAQEMQAEMERLARIELRKQKSDERKEKLDDRRSKMKAEFESLKESLKK